MNLRSLILIFFIILFVVFIGFKTIKIKNEISILEKQITQLKEENVNLRLKKITLLSINNLSKYFNKEDLEEIGSEDIYVINEK